MEGPPRRTARTASSVKTVDGKLVWARSLKKGEAFTITAEQLSQVYHQTPDARR
jgi:hypothetical protein